MHDLNIGDSITFDFYGKLLTGVITVVDKAGYWVQKTNEGDGNAFKRCFRDKVLKYERK